jgi:gliding motility-associated-like protein
VIVRDEYLCADTASSYLMVLDAPNLLLTSTSTSCTNSSDGQVSVSTTGMGPFDISWYPSGSSDSTLTDLSAGWYWVEVTDDQNCMTTDSVQVNQAPSMIIGTSIEPAGCPNGLGSAGIELLENGDQYEVFWMCDQSTEISLVDVPQGIYTVTVQNLNGCSESVELTIPNMSGLTMEIDTIFHETCVGYNDGFAIATALGGYPQYEFLWSPGNFETDSVGQLSPGIYVVSISDSLLCIVSDTVVINQAIPIEVEIASTTALCDLPLGTIDVTVFGGVSPYLIDWREDLPNEFFVDSLIGMEYGFTVYDSLGCALDTTVTVESMNILELELSTVNAQTFPGEEFTLFAELQNGLEDMQFDWSIGAEIFCTNCYEVQTSILESSWFVLEVVDANGCYALDSIFIEVIPCTNAFAPTIFSPNADALNDSWCVLGSCFKSFEAKLYDQWGEMIFETDDKSACWDGTYKGKPVQSGVYVFRFVGTTFEGELISDHGTLRVIR